MPRPHLALPYDVVIAAYEREGTVRGASRRLGVSRSVVQRCLREAGVTPLNRADAMDALRLRRQVSTPTRSVVTEERFDDDAMLRRTRLMRFVPCVWPNCDRDVSVGALCEGHSKLAANSSGTRCVWPMCHSSSFGGLCYSHQKIADGLMQKAHLTPSGHEARL